MPSQEDIQGQHELLAAHRRTLNQLLKQQALLGEAFAPPSVASGIDEARDQIRRLKRILRGWEVAVEDLPDDEDAGEEGPPAPRRARVVISYRRSAIPDEAIATQLYEALRLQHDVFIDRVMPVGTLWAERIEDEIRRADFLVVLLSASSVHSEMVEAEIATAHHLAKVQSGRPAILPVRLSYREPFQYPLSFYLDGINWAFWSDPADTARLIDDVQGAIAGGGLRIDSLELKSDLVVPAAPQPLPQPLPAAQPPAHSIVPPALELPEGTMDAQSGFYVARDADRLALDAIARQGVTITIKGPRQMGKSSLLIRTVEAARAAGKRVAFLDFQLFDHGALASAELFFKQFCAWLTDELELAPQVDEYWAMPLGNSQRSTRYVGRYVLKSVGGPLVLAMDEVETIFDTDFRSDFFGMLRSWHNSRATMPAWKQLDLVLVTSTEPYQLIDNLNQSPFNVGQVVDLVDFTPAQVTDLNARHGRPFAPDDEGRLFALLGGHPYLARRALYLAASGQIAPAEQFTAATDDHGPFGDHLRYHLFRLHDKPELVQGLLQAIRTNSCDDERVFFRLRGAGLVRRDGRAVLPRCQLYADYFREHLAGARTTERAQ